MSDEHHGAAVRPDGTRFSMGQFVRLIATTKPRYRLLAGGMALLVAAAGVQVYVPQLASTLVNGFSAGLDAGLLARVVVLFVAMALLSALGGTILGIFGENVIQNLRKNLWRKLTTLPVSYFDAVKAGELSSRLVNDTSQVKQLLATTFPQTVSSLVLVAGSVAMMIRMDWQMSVAMLITMPAVLAIMTPIIRFGRKVGRLRQDALAQFNGVASETLGEIRLVKTSNAERQAQRRADAEIDQLFKVGTREAVFDSSMRPIMMMTMLGMVFGLLAYGMQRIATGAMAIGTLMSFIMYLFNLIGAVPSVATLFTELAKAAGSTKRVQELLDEPSEDLEGGSDLCLAGQTLRAEHLDFSYVPGEPVLKNVSFEAKPGQVVAFVGPSGGGKSTIFSLLERFYEPDHGSILVGDTDVRAIKIAAYRRQIGFVSQDSAIMSGTIRENLTYGLDDPVDDDALWEVLSLAYAREFVEQMPDGLVSEVGERGIRVSGGQRQRIAIARAFLRNPTILMLDEATASLDSESEMMVQRALANLMQGRTTLVIAHRLATIVDSDMIYFVENGRITGSGTHDELVATHETYAAYVSEQFRLGGTPATCPTSA